MSDPAGPAELRLICDLARAIVAGREPHLPVQSVTRALAQTVLYQAEIIASKE